MNTSEEAGKEREEERRAGREVWELENGETKGEEKRERVGS